MLMKHALLLLAVLTAVAFGCKDESEPPPQETATDTGPDMDAGTQPDSGPGIPTDTAMATDTDPGTATDTGLPVHACSGVVCNRPPANICISTFDLNVFTEAGWCDNGECVYGGWSKSCVTGTCGGGVCADAPCQGVRCHTPPASVCVDADTLRVYNRIGYCAVENGTPTCAYASEERVCLSGCLDGRCNEENPCDRIACDKAPTRFCEASGALTVWDQLPRCDTGGCVYSMQTVACASGCGSGCCNGENGCGTLRCNTPPASYCLDDTTLRAYHPAGVCEAGACIYEPNDIACASGCVGGQCAEDSCAGVVCDDAPVPYCQDDNVLVHWDGTPGTCTGGLCSYTMRTTACASGCENGQCVGEPCIGVVCSDPPAPHCNQEGDLITYQAPGSCGDGVCGYQRLPGNCENGCSAGRCVTEPEPDDTDTQCVGQPDFTACTLVTEPDRSYDICVDEVCVSPGCGDETCNVPAPHIPVTDTGQLTCYNDSIGVVNPCPVSGEEYYGQDGQYGWDLGHMTAERFTRDTTTLPENPLVTDALTGLTWQGCAGGLTDGSCITGAEEELLWTEAVAYCDDLDWAGRTDWRLPDIYELQSIIDMGELDPVIDQSIFPFTPSIGFWSSSSSAYVPSSSWYVDFTMGLVTYDEKANHFAARCVRGDPGTPLRFEPATLAGDRVVEDPLNGLTWQGCPAGLTGDACETGTLEERTWSEALEYCESLDWGGNTDWRMPNGNELFTMVKTRDYFPAIDLTIFPVTPADSYDTCEFWTSTTIRDGDADLNFDGAVTVIFSTGARENYNKTLTQCVRCVRGGLQ